MKEVQTGIFYLLVGTWMMVLNFLAYPAVVEAAEANRFGTSFINDLMPLVLASVTFGLALGVYIPGAKVIAERIAYAYGYWRAGRHLR